MSFPLLSRLQRKSFRFSLGRVPDCARSEYSRLALQKMTEHSPTKIRLTCRVEEEAAIMIARLSEI